MKGKPAGSVDDYLAGYTGELRDRLDAMRAAIRAAAPKAEERISYGMPAYFQDGVLVYFGAFKHHIGFFPTARGTTAFAAELVDLQTSKGTVQLPHDQPLPLALVKQIVRARIKQNAAKT